MDKVNGAFQFEEESNDRTIGNIVMGLANFIDD